MAHSNSSNSSLSQEILARRMLAAGYTSKIVMIEASMSYKQVRRVMAAMRADGIIIERKSLKGGASLITSASSKASASLLMKLYRNLGGSGVEVEIKLAKLHDAYQMYTALLNELPERIEPIDLPDAWSLARELRSAEAMFEFCQQCGCDYFTSVNQRTSIECPFCSKKATH